MEGASRGRPAAAGFVYLVVVSFRELARGVFALERYIVADSNSGIAPLLNTRGPTPNANSGP